MVKNMDILTAKKELYYSKLKHFKSVVGCGVQQDNEGEYICIFLAKITKLKIPVTYEGYRVKFEVTGIIRLQ